MIAEVNTLESVGLRPAASPVTLAVATQTMDSSLENIEGEIARLTWAVLDGSASPNDRNQLAELVRSQHALRHRSRL